MKMRVRPATPEDSRKIAEVHLATWRSAYAGIVLQEYLDSLLIEPRVVRWNEILQRNDAKETTLVSVVGEGVVGFISIGPNRVRTLGFDGEVYSLYIHGDYQKKGIGAALLKSGMVELRKRGYGSVAVWVLKDNPGRRFYGKMGGREIGEKSIRIGEQDLHEVAYGWDSIESIGIEADASGLEKDAP